MRLDSGPARPSPSRGRARILREAAKLFAQNGYAGTSTRDIAIAAGIRQPSLYSHFRTKSDILLEVVLQTVDPPLAKADELARTPGLTARERLLALLEFDVGLLAAVPRHMGLMAMLQSAGDEVLDTFWVRYQQLHEHYRTLVRAAAVEDGRPLAGDALVGVVLSLIESVPVRRMLEPDLDPTEIVAHIRLAAERLLF